MDVRLHLLAGAVLPEEGQHQQAHHVERRERRGRADRQLQLGLVREAQGRSLDGFVHLRAALQGAPQ